MATYACAIATHQTAGTGVDEIDLAADAGYVEVLARANPTPASQAPIFFCVDGQGGPAGDGVPTVGGVDTFVVPAAVGAAVRVRSRKTSATVVKLISTSGQPYSVTAVND